MHLETLKQNCQKLFFILHMNIILIRSIDLEKLTAELGGFGCFVLEREFMKIHIFNDHKTNKGNEFLSQTLIF